MLVKNPFWHIVCLCSCRYVLQENEKGLKKSDGKIIFHRENLQVGPALKRDFLIWYPKDIFYAAKAAFRGEMMEQGRPKRPQASKAAKAGSSVNVFSSFHFASGLKTVPEWNDRFFFPLSFSSQWDDQIAKNKQVFHFFFRDV